MDNTRRIYQLLRGRTFPNDPVDLYDGEIERIPDLPVHGNLFVSYFDIDQEFDTDQKNRKYFEFRGNPDVMKGNVLGGLIHLMAPSGEEDLRGSYQRAWNSFNPVPAHYIDLEKVVKGPFYSDKNPREDLVPISVARIYFEGDLNVLGFLRREFS